jgi:hypothetical protein
MMTFVLAAAMFVGALCVAEALDSATTEAPAARAPWLQDCSRRIAPCRSL